MKITTGMINIIEIDMLNFDTTVLSGLLIENFVY